MMLGIEMAMACRRWKSGAAMATALLLVACSPAGDGNGEAPPPEVAPAAPLPATPLPVPAAPHPIDNAEPLPGPGEVSPDAARRTLRRYFDLIAARQYDVAYGIWARGGEASGMTMRAFSESFAQYSHYLATVGDPDPVEGAAGSLYIKIPVEVRGTRQDGRPFALSGKLTLRRINDVPGSSEEDRRWHLWDSALAPLPMPGGDG